MVALVAIMLILVNSVAINRLIPPSEDERPRDQPWNTTVDAEVVDEDTIWEGRTGFLERPVKVSDGARLRLVDCDLSLRMEDVVQFRCPYLLVEEGATLELDGSSLGLVVDPRLEGAYVGPYEIQHYSGGPYLARVVNLAGTVEPRLVFDLLWRDEGTRLVVAAQRSHRSALEDLLVIEPKNPRPHQWTQYEVPLAAYAGTTPRVVIFFDSFPQDIAIISGLRVLDGEAGPPNDIVSTGDLRTDHWEIEGFLAWDNVLSWYAYDVELVRGLGEVILRDSTITSPPGIARGGDSEYERESRRGEILSPTPRNVWAMYHMFHLSVISASLTLERCTLVNVPLAVNGSEVAIRGCTIVGESDQVALNGCTGEVNDTVFRFTGPSPVLQWYNDGSRPLWGLSVENVTEDRAFIVRDCTFVDQMLALDLGHARVEVTGCMFEGATRLAVWDHASNGTGGWAGLAAGNAFRDCVGALYLRTEAVLIDFNGTLQRIRLRFVGQDGQEESTCEVLPGLQLVHYSDRRARVILPNYYIESTGVLQLYRNMTLEIDAYPKYYVSDLPPESGSITLDLATLPRNDEHDRTPYTPSKDITLVEMFEMGYEPLPNGTREFQAYFRASAGALEAENLTMSLYLDGHQLSSGDPFNSSAISYFVSRSDADFATSVWLTVGPHELGVVTRGMVWDEEGNVIEQPVEIANQTLYVLRADASTDPIDLRVALQRERAYIIIDPNTTVEVDDVPLYGANWYGPDYDLAVQYITILGREGSALSIGGNGQGYNTSLLMYLHGELDLELAGLDARYMSLYSGDYEMGYQYVLDEGPLRLEMRDGSIGYLSIQTGFCRAELINMSIGSIELDVGEGGLTMKECNLSSGWMRYIGVGKGPVRVIDCDISGPRNDLRIYSTDNSTVEVKGTRFENSTLRLYFVGPESSSRTIDVTGCEFRGQGAVLVAGGRDGYPNVVYDTDPRFFPNSTIRENTFSGMGAGMLLHPSVFPAVLGANAMGDGAKVFVWKRLDLTVTVINVTTDPEMTFYEPIGNAIACSELPFDIRWDIRYPLQSHEKDREVFVDVTSQFALGADRMEIWVAAFMTGDYMRHLVGFSLIDLRVPKHQLRYEAWPQLDGLLRARIADWPWVLP